MTLPYDKPFIVLDAETTGLNGEICQIAIIDDKGTTLFDSLIRPYDPIPADATAIHGITNEMVKGAPTWIDVTASLVRLLLDRHVIIYNAEFDLQMMMNSSEVWGDNTRWNEDANYYCAMRAYAEFWGDWSDYHQSYRWQKLIDACRQQGLVVNGAHSALGDCLMTLELVRKMRDAR